MKILFSPSEGKTTLATNPPFGEDSFLFSDLFDARLVVLERYNDYIHSLNNDELNQYFGLKNGIDFLVNIFKMPTCKAIQRYDGVAYDYLEYNLLDKEAQEYIDKNTIIFSNLFGPIQGDDLLPFYRMKQGRNLPGIEIDKYYKKEFGDAMDEYLKEEVVVDLRAGHYEKFYKAKNYITMKFLKNNKVVSHWAKAYRGIFLREMAKNKITTKEQLFELHIQNLALKEIQQSKNKTTIVFEIKE